jgi:hypothetical protein
MIGKGSLVSGEFEVREVRLQDTLSIGRYLFPEPTITFSDFDNEILIGSAPLREFIVTFDQKNHRVRFVRKGVSRANGQQKIRGYAHGKKNAADLSVHRRPHTVRLRPERK